jgi:hypothetical protein
VLPGAPCRQLLRDKEVIFAGYKFPHPLDYHILIKVQTKGKKSPREVMDDALSSLCEEFQDIQSKFQVRACKGLLECSVLDSLCGRSAFAGCAAAFVGHQHRPLPLSARDVR